MTLNFDAGSIEFLREKAVMVDPSTGLKLEDLALVPTDLVNSLDPLDRDVWLASEAHSNIAKTSKFLSKDFGTPDLSSFDRETFSHSRLIRVNAATGDILEEATLPAFTQWNLEYDWESTHCIGTKPFNGVHALSIVDSSDPAYSHTLIVGTQSALYQDGSPPTEFSGSATRILMYGLKALVGDEKRTSSTAQYLKSFRYDTSHLTLKSYQKGAAHFNALFGILAIDDTSFLVAECEDLTGFRLAGKKIVNRIFYVQLKDDETVDHCTSLLECDIDAPLKRLVWENNGDTDLEGLAWGPVLEDGRKSIALTFENDDKIGVHFELFAFNPNKIEGTKFWTAADIKDDLLQRRIITVSVSIALLFVVVVAQLFWIKRLETKKHDSSQEVSVSAP